MKREVIAALALSLAFALPAFAAESNEPPKGTPPTFEQRKAQYLKNIDERSARLQEEKTCIQAAKSENDFRACRNKFGPPHTPPFGPEGPPGMARPGGPSGPPPKGGQPPE